MCLFKLMAASPKGTALLEDAIGLLEDAIGHTFPIYDSPGSPSLHVSNERDHTASVRGPRLGHLVYR